MLNNPTFLLITTFLGSIFLHHFLPRNIRNGITPWVFAYMLWVLLFGMGTTGVYHFFATAFNFVIVMVLSNGCTLKEAKRNPVWTSFLFFWSYLVFSGMFGLFPYAATVSYLTTLLMSFATGVYIAMWVVNTEGSLRRLAYAVVWSAVAFCAYSILHGGFSNAQMMETGRMALDASTFEEGFAMNQNSMAAYVLCYLPFLIIALLLPIRNSKEQTMKLLSIGAILIMTLLLIRSGSRAGGLGLLPCCWYFIYSTTNRMKRRKRISLFIIATILICVGVIVTMRGIDRLRSFDIRNQEMNDLYGKGFSLDKVTTGRTRIYENLINDMSPLQMIFGRGLIRNVHEKGSDVQGKVMGGNDHSSFVSIFVRGGIVGSLLFIVFIVMYMRRAVRLGDRGRLALFLLIIWLMQNLGESWGINGGRISVLLGMGIGFLTNQRIKNSELMNDAEKRFYPTMPFPFYP